MEQFGTVKIREMVPEQLKSDLKQEKSMIKLLTESIQHCTKVGDFTTRGMLEAMAQDEDEHINWIETQLETIKQVRLGNYLSEQIKKES